MDSYNGRNNGAIHRCFGISKDCATYTFVLTFSTFIFVASMILTVYFTHIDSVNKAVVVLILGSCLLYLLGFIGNMYSIYYCKPNSGLSENDENSNNLSQIVGSSVQSTSPNVQPPDIVSFPRGRELFRTPPPPPYQVQMSEMSRMLLPRTSRIPESSAREAEITEEARKLIQRIYEEIKKTNQLEPKASIDEQSIQHRVQTPDFSVRRQERMSPKISHQNLAIQKQQTAENNSPDRGLRSVDFRSNQVKPERAATSALPTQLDLARLVIGSEGCSNAAQQLSPRIPGRPPVDFHTNQIIKQKVTPNSPSSQRGLEKFIIDSEGYAAAPSRFSPRRESFLKVAQKRKLAVSPQEMQTRPKTKEIMTHIAAVDGNYPNSEYEEIETLGGGTQSVGSSEAARDSVEYYCNDSEFGEPSEQASAISTAVSEFGPEESKMKFGTSSVKGRRQLSTLSTWKFCQLGQSPESLLDAIAMCFELNPEEWMAAWKLSLRGVPPNERARILGVRLQEDS